MAFKEDSMELRAYTATKDKTGKKATLLLLLYATVMDGMMSNPNRWKKRLLPHGYGKDAKVAHAKALKTLVNVVLKKACKQFETILLENIHLPSRSGTSGTGKIPTLNGIVAKLHNKEFGQVDGCVPVCNEIYAYVGHLPKAQHAYIAEYKDGATLWNIVNEKLEYLFAIQCLSEDTNLFGKMNPLEKLRPLTSFSILNKLSTCDTLKALNETWGNNLPDN
ncbi:hypothetical protein DFH28DRAFT_1078836 [Melampsora americana]|nr:hypothetical protein DFH28DRAFT_1078836 [Melampsora americana]